MASRQESEIDTLGYPRAALLGFRVGVMAYNTLLVVQGALRAVHGETVVREEVSGYHLVHRARAEVGGLDTLLEDKDGEPFRRMPVAELAELLVEIVRHIPLPRIKKAKRGPKKPVPKRTRFKNTPHVSARRLSNTRPRQLMTRRGRAHPTHVDGDRRAACTREGRRPGDLGPLRQRPRLRYPGEYPGAQRRPRRRHRRTSPGWRKHRGIERLGRVASCREMARFQADSKRRPDRIRTKVAVWLPVWLPAVADRRGEGR
jgi:hypothetical protein